MFNLLKKDLKILFSDKKTLSLLILMPLINATILGFALAGIFDDGLPFDRLNVAVVKNYNYDVTGLNDKLSGSFYNVLIGEEAMEDMIAATDTVDMEALFFEEFLDDEDLEKYLTYEIMNQQTAESLMASKALDGMILLPENFLVDSQLNFTTIFTNPVQIEVVTPADDNMKAMVLESIIQGFVDELINIHSVKNIVLSLAINDRNNVVEEDIEEIIDRQNDLKYTFETTSLQGKKLITAKSYYSAAMLSMFLLFSAGYGSKLLLKERNIFTYQRQEIAGVSFKHMVISKTLTVFLLVVLQSATVLIVTHFIFDIIWGDLISLIAIVLASALCVAGMGQLLGVITLKQDNFKVANVLESGLFQLFAFFGGSFLPLSALPSVLQPLSYLVVNGLALRAYLGVLEGQTVSGIILPLGLLVSYGFLFMGMSVFLLKQERSKHYV